MEKLSDYQISILRQVEKYEKGISEEEIESAIGKKNVAAFDELFAEKYIEQEILENRGLLEPPANTLLFLPNIEYGNFILSEKGTRALAEDDFNREHSVSNKSNIINNYKVHGTNIIANHDVNITNSTIAETVNNTQGIPEELKAELTEFLTYLKDSHSPLADKQIKVGVFLDKVKNLFGDVVTGVASNLIVAAMSGQLPILPL